MCRCSVLGISPVGQRRDRLTERQPADQIRGVVFIRTKVADRRTPAQEMPMGPPTGDRHIRPKGPPMSEGLLFFGGLFTGPRQSGAPVGLSKVFLIH
jgi:hypothetical protein